MKKIFKIILGLTTAFIIFIIGNCNAKAESIKFYKADYISDMFITREEGSIKYFETARFIRRNSDDMFAYCIEPLAQMDNAASYYSSSTYSKLSPDIVDKLKLAAYYGYGYSEHGAKKWYAITQMLMWRYMESESRVYFTNTLNGSKTTKYDGDINSLKNLINNHYTKPSFNYTNNNVNVEDVITLTDYNNVLNNYSIESNGGLNIQKDGNTLKISSNKTGNYNVKLVKKNNYYNPVSIFYLNGTSQDLLVTGNISDVVSNFTINVTGGYINIDKTDSETKACISQGESKLNGTVYEIYKDNNLMDTLTIDSTCKSKSRLLPFGDYIIKEKAPGYGYNLDNDIHYVSLNSDNSTITLSNVAKKSKITLTKLYGSEIKNEYSKEANVDFGIYNSFNELLYTYTTNEEGIIEFSLPYGSYVIKQLSTTKNYLKSKDIDIVVDDNTPNEINYEIKDNLLTSKLKINKKDTETKKLITDTTEFKIYDKNANKFLKNNDNTEIFKTNSEGILLTNIYLEPGDYCLIESKAPNGYTINNNCLNFSIDDNNEFIFYNDELYLQLDFFNNKENKIPIKEEIPQKEIIIKKEIKKYSSKTIVIPDTLSYIYYPVYLFYEKKKVI